MEIYVVSLLGKIIFIRFIISNVIRVLLENISNLRVNNYFYQNFKHVYEKSQVTIFEICTVLLVENICKIILNLQVFVQKITNYSTKYLQNFKVL